MRQEQSERHKMAYYIENFGDDPCEECEEQIGKKARPGADVAKQPNCKCLVVEDSQPDSEEQNNSMDKAMDKAMDKDIDKAINEEDLDKMADMTKPIKDQIVYRGFVDDRFSDDEVEYDFDQTLVMICPQGEWTGGTSDGKIVTQKIDETALDTLAAQQEEVLVDRDHESMKSVLERDTRAYGWASDFVAVKNAGDYSGLYGVIKWSDKGKDLIKDRSYRFLSPAFELDKNGRPVKLVSIGLTNRPNFKMAPIINAIPDDSTDGTTTSTTKEIMTKEEIVEIVKQILAEQKPAEEKTAEETTEQKKEQTQTVDNACGDKKEQTVDAQPKTETEQQAEPKKEEMAEEKVEEKPVKKVKEVIKEEVLNAIPDSSLIDSKPWKSLHGDALQRWMYDNLKQ